MALTPLAISVLALLNERPMHPYEMVQTLLERHEDRIVKVRPGSLYHTVERLTAAELVQATGTERAGNRPERTTYTITPAGQDALTTRLSELIGSPVNEYPAFPVALSEAHNIDRGEVLELLASRVTQLQQLIDEVDALIASARTRDVPEAYWVTADYLRAMHTTERDWIAHLIDRIESKDLPWPTN
jgi:DNA-binding PadR family transcriptional regulator